MDKNSDSKKRRKRTHNMTSHKTTDNNGKNTSGDNDQEEIKSPKGKKKMAMRDVCQSNTVSTEGEKSAKDEIRNSSNCCAPMKLKELHYTPKSDVSHEKSSINLDSSSQVVGQTCFASSGKETHAKGSKFKSSATMTSKKKGRREKDIAFQTKWDIDNEKKKQKETGRKLKKEKATQALREAKSSPKESSGDVSTPNDDGESIKIQLCTPKDKGDNSKQGGSIDKLSTPTICTSNISDASYISTTKRVNTTDMQEESTVNFESTGVNVYEYAESRAFEIMNLKRALERGKNMQNKRVFQSLPRHMRRRAASHDIKRIPRRLRERAKNEKVVPKKPTTRKYKRRPKNLMEEYNRRSKLNSWLETHMWHAKRFKMSDKWGYRVPAKPCDKAFRAMYRASANGCLLQDKSYMEFIEVIGPETVIIKGFQRITSTNCVGGIRLDDEKCLSGLCYGEELIYIHDRYPCNVIGPVKFIWTSESDSADRKLMIICNPSISMKILVELEILFNVVKLQTDEISVPQFDPYIPESDLHNTSESNNTEKDVDSHLPCALHTADGQCELQSAKSIRVIHHKLDFIMFSLTGPLSCQILQNILTLPKYTEESNQSVSNDTIRRWTVSNDSLCQRKCALYNLLVEDPRHHIPYKKQNPFSAKTSESTGYVPISTAVSSVWDEQQRKKAKDGKLTDEQINNIRSQMLIPGSALPVNSVQIPLVVMLRNPKHEGEQKYGCGFDLVLPSGWGMPFWIALVYQGASVGGVEADENIALEALSTHFPSHYPDSNVMQEEVLLVLKEREKKHLSYPPDKRTNYDKLGVKNPFAIPWMHLVAEWKHIIKLLMHGCSLICDVQFSKCDQDFYVLREKTLLLQLRKLVTGKTDSKDKEQIITELLRYPDSLIHVSLTPLQTGIPKENAALCIPSTEDVPVQNAKENSDTDECGRYSEPHHKGFRKEFPYICKKHDILLPNAATIGNNTRWIIGYVQNGAYSYTRGKGGGIGFISTIGLVYLLHVNNNTKLLFRNINTFEYLFCSFDILLL